MAENIRPDFLTEEEAALSPLGMNLEDHEYFSPNWPFADAMRNSELLKDNDTQDRADLTDLSTAGWPLSFDFVSGQEARCLMFRHGQAYPTGMYTGHWEGDGEVDFDFNASRVTTFSSGQQLFVAVPNNDGIRMIIATTATLNPIRNVQLMMPYHTKAQTFHRDFVRNVKPFSVIRFMEWSEVTSSPIADWADRTLPDYQTQTGTSGVAYEHMLQLSNDTNAEPWITIPHLTTAAYWVNLAQLVKDRLDPSLRVWIEYSNETWNGGVGFTQFDWCVTNGIDQGLSADPTEANDRYHSQQSVALFNAMTTVLGEDRVVRVMSGQNDVVGRLRERLEWQDAHTYTDALAVNYYLGEDMNSSSGAETAAGQPTDVIFGTLYSELATNGRVWDRLENHRVLSERYGVEMVSYECGQHLVNFASSTTLEEKFRKMNRQENMASLYREFFNVWRGMGGRLLCMFNDVSEYDQFGNFGARELGLDELSETPKGKVMLEFIKKNPRWWD